MKTLKKFLVPALAVALVLSGMALSLTKLESAPASTETTVATADPMAPLNTLEMITEMQETIDLHSADPFAPYPDNWPKPDTQAFLDCMASPRPDTGEYIYTAWDPTFHSVPNSYYDPATGHFVEETVRAELNDTFGRAVVYNKMAWEWDGICQIHTWHTGAANVTGSVTSPQNFWACYMETTPFFQTFNNGNPGFTRDEVLARSACAPANTPSITSIVPPSGDIAGGYSITITGTNFGAAPTATVNGNACAVTSGADTQVVCTVPAAPAAGAVPVVVTNTITGLVSPAYTFTYTSVPVPVAPTITGLNPTSGEIAGGYPLTITGTNFGLTPTATVNGVNCPVTSSTNTQVVCTTPATGAPATVPVVVTNNDNGLSSAPQNFTYLNTIPDILSINPTSGPEAGGTMVVITGTNFNTGATATFAGNQCANITLIGSTQLVCYTPAGVGNVDVVVTNPSGQSDAVAGGYTYVPNGDFDNDKNPDVTDNCPNIPNRVQRDTDSDGHGDRCDVDDDNDTILDRKWALSVKNVNGDNCQHIANPDQLDSDGDLWGNVCDDQPFVANAGNNHFYDDYTFEYCQLTNSYSVNSDPYCYDMGAEINMAKPYELCTTASDGITPICFREYDTCECTAAVCDCRLDLYRATDAAYLIDNWG